mmetsp:Transcript_11404/g.22346  ORF Transcript_11404/g.22346 Transcript_11404/m.22346 type:complete len:313 (+) Transcript_11404:1981-2919(+)
MSLLALSNPEGVNDGNGGTFKKVILVGKTVAEEGLDTLSDLVTSLLEHKLTRHVLVDILQKIEHKHSAGAEHVLKGNMSESGLESKLTKLRCKNLTSLSITNISRVCTRAADTNGSDGSSSGSGSSAVSAVLRAATTSHAEILLKRVLCTECHLAHAGAGVVSEFLELRHEQRVVRAHIVHICNEGADVSSGNGTLEFHLCGTIAETTEYDGDDECKTLGINGVDKGGVHKLIEARIDLLFRVLKSLKDPRHELDSLSVSHELTKVVESLTGGVADLFLGVTVALHDGRNKNWQLTEELRHVALSEGSHALQ